MSEPADIIERERRSLTKELMMSNSVAWPNTDPQEAMNIASWAMAGARDLVQKERKDEGG
jgi:hypothetical protein